MPVKTENKIQKLHFGIDGNWLTWLLRHLWVEGNEIKAIRMFNTAFPNYATIEYIKTFFIDIVSGKKKFTGVNIFQLVKDNTKYWSTTANAKPSKSFPLLQSFEDVILLKKVKLYLSEIELRDFRLRRRFLETQEGVCHNALNWFSASEENKIENRMREKVNSYYTDIRNLSTLLNLDLKLDLIPEKAEKLDTKVSYIKGIGFRNRGDTGMNNGFQLFSEIMNTVKPYDIYFKSKYKCDMLFIDEEYIRNMCGIASDKIEYYRMTKESVNEKEIYDAVQKAIPNIDLDRYISQSIEESHREKIIAEDVKTTNWTSGYIDREGRFYGCTDINHRNFSQEICEMLKINDCNDEKFDAQIYLDKIGYVKVSVNRFYWDENIRLTQAQKDTIYDYVKAKNIDKTAFYSSKYMTYEEAFKELI